MIPMRRPFILLALAISAFFASSNYARTVWAEAPLGIESPTPSPPAPGGTEQAVVARYWELGRPRLFLATTLEAGYAYVRPRFAFGYGQPYWRWLGLEAYPVLSLGGVGQYLGFGASLPGLSLRAGGRYTYPFSRAYLTPQDSFSRLDLDIRGGNPKAQYLALEAELTGTIPLFYGSLFAVLSGYRTEFVEEGFYLFEESLRSVMKPPYIWRGRLGYLLSFGIDGSIRVGPAAEVIGLPGRDEFVIRGGVLGSVLINAHLEAQASFIPVLVSPDTLGLAGGDFGQLGIRFSWATGSTPDSERVKNLLEEMRQAPRD
jgi:hypothetical protein